MMTTCLSALPRATLGLCLALCAAIMTPTAVAAQAQDQVEGWRNLYPGLASGAYPEEWVGDAEQFIRRTLDNASASYPDPLVQVATMFRDGGSPNYRNALTPDPARAADFYEYAAGLGARHAMPEIAQLYLTSPDIPDHCVLAKDWIDAYLEFGRPPPMTMERLDKTSCPDLDAASEDLARRIERLQARSERGLTYSRTWLGDLYAEGGELPRDPDRAIALWTSAMEDGNATAAGRLLRAYAKGSLVPRDCDAARALFERSVRGDISIVGDVRTAWLEQMSRDTPKGYCAEPDRTGRVPPTIAPPPMPNETPEETQRRLADPNTIAAAEATGAAQEQTAIPRAQAPDPAPPSAEEIAREKAKAERLANYKRIFEEGARSAQTGRAGGNATNSGATATPADIGGGYADGDLLRAMMEGAAGQATAGNAVIYVAEFMKRFSERPDCAHLINPTALAVAGRLAEQTVRGQTVGSAIHLFSMPSGSFEKALTDGLEAGMRPALNVLSVTADAQNDADLFYSRFGCQSGTARALIDNMSVWADRR